MKTFLLLPLLLAAPAFAGTSAKQVVAPAPDPCLTTWFAGASVGYLTELETAMYNAHFGVTNSCWKVGPGTISLFAEVGYADKDWSWSDNFALNDQEVRFKETLDLTVVPITANIKFDFPVANNLNFYIGAGVGVAWVDLEVTQEIGNFDDSFSDSDWVFTAQIFAGLSYSVSTNCDIYGGARWIYYADPTLFGADWPVDDDWLFELGVRFKF
jgi:opacity protein-like surface antigen